jgi:hypothetical protein
VSVDHSEDLAKRVCAFLLQQLDGSEQLDAPLSTFTVSPGKRYRFRVAYVGGGRACPVSVSVDSHMLRVISLDGNPITPRDVTSVVMAAGQHLIVGFKLPACSSTALRVVRDGLRMLSAAANMLNYQWRTYEKVYSNFNFGRESNIASLHKSVHVAKWLRGPQIWKDSSVVDV